MTPQRRGLAIALTAALMLPAIAMPWFAPQSVSMAESRQLAPAPAVPMTPRDWRALPARVDAFVSDHFAFRDALIRIWTRLFGTAGLPPAALVAEGKDGHLFLFQGLLRSTGQELDPKLAADYASFVCEASRRIKARGAKMLFAIAPSPAAIYPEFAPAYALPTRSPTEYDLILAEVRACGAPAVDLRPPLLQAKPEGALYRLTDSHWTARGALVGFNAVVDGFGRPDWRIDRTRLAWSKSSSDSGDLLRLAGRPPLPEPIETTPRADPPATARQVELSGLDTGSGPPPILLETGRRGPALLIIGDSYAKTYFARLFAPLVGRVVWVDGQACRFDWRILDRSKPDLVLIMQVDRLAECAPANARPANFR